MNLPEAFLSKIEVDPFGGCWLWSACWRACCVIKGDCDQCPETEMVDSDVCIRGCRAQAEECINVVETGNPWRKTSQAELRAPWVVLAGPQSSGAEG